MRTLSELAFVTGGTILFVVFGGYVGRLVHDACMWALLLSYEWPWQALVASFASTAVGAGLGGLFGYRWSVGRLDSQFAAETIIEDELW